MAISSAKLIYDFHRKYHAIISGKTQDLALVDIIAYLNEAQEIWFENRVFVAQSNQKIRNDLRVFKNDKIKLGCSKIDNNCCLAKYPKNLYQRLNQIAITKKDCCPDEKEIIPRILQSDDLHEARRNPYRKANFFFEQLNAIETSNGLIIYHDNELEVTDVLIDYYRKPNEIHGPSHELCPNEGYYLYDGRMITKDSDFEVDATYVNNLITDIAVLLASRDVDDRLGFETMLAKMLNAEKIGTAGAA